MVEECVLLFDTERGSHRACMRGIIALDLFANGFVVLDTEPFHDDFYTEVHWRAYPHADDLRHVAKYGGSSPPTDQDVTALGQQQNFLRRIKGQLPSVNQPSFEYRCRTIDITQQRACFDAETLGNVIRNNFGIDDRKAQSIGYTRRNVYPKRSYLSCHRDHGH